MSAAHVFNGLDGDRGGYLLAPMTDGELGRKLFDRRFDVQRFAATVDRFRGTVGDIDSQRLDQVGWGLVMADGAGEGVREALSELCDLRQREAGGLYRDHLSGYKPLVYKPGESAVTFLDRYGVRFEDPVLDPGLMPYYLLLVGGPEEIPFEVQYKLDIQYAVGRISFDRKQDYAQYGAAVAAAARGDLLRQREVALFAVKNSDDDATQQTARFLMRPLNDALTAQRNGWPVHARCGAQADRPSLAGLMNGKEGLPALLLTASHGAGFKCGSENQKKMQGALVCQEWQGKNSGPPARQHYFAAEDLGDEAQVGGLVAMLFACFSAGTPEFDSFRLDDYGQPVRIAEGPMVSPLIKRMMSHPRGAALAVIGHVDRAWTSSFGGDQFAATGFGVFQELVQRLLKGKRLGWATEELNHRYGALGAELSSVWERILTGDPAVTPEYLAATWRSTNDARNLVVFGDPAIRLAVGY